MTDKQIRKAMNKILKDRETWGCRFPKGKIVDVTYSTEYPRLFQETITITFHLEERVEHAEELAVYFGALLEGTKR